MTISVEKVTCLRLFFFFFFREVVWAIWGSKSRTKFRLGNHGNLGDISLISFIERNFYQPNVFVECV